MRTPKPSDTEHRARELARALLGPSWPRVRRIPLIRREVRESLSDSALEILFAAADLLIEGDRDQGDRAYATVMVTLDLVRSAALLRDRADEATAERLAELMRGSVQVRARLIELARPRLAELLDADPRSLRIELVPAIRVVGTRVLIDGDVVVSIASPRAIGQVGR